MRKRLYLGTLVLAASVGILGTTVGARPLSADDDSGISRSELGRLDLFLDTHPDIAKAVEANPALATNREFLASHPEWLSFLEDHAGIRQGLTANASAFMRGEDRFEAAEAKSPHPAKEAMGDHLRSFDGFLDQHPAIAKQLEAKPSLINDKGYLEAHPELADFLEDHAAIRDSLVSNPSAFMKGIAAVDAADTPPATMPPTKAPPPPGADNDGLTRSQVAELDNFLDANPGLAKQLEAKPALINDSGFVKDNPDLVSFLQNHPGLAEDWRNNATLTMTNLRRMEQLEAARAIGNERDVDLRSAVERFDNFLDNHPAIAAEIDHHSSLPGNVAFIDAHPELKAYLQKNPGVAAELRNNPQSFMNLVSALDKQDTPRTERKEDLKPTLALNHK